MLVAVGDKLMVDEVFVVVVVAATVLSAHLWKWLRWLGWYFCLIHCGLVLCNIFLLCLLTLPFFLLYICFLFLFHSQILINASINCLISFCDTVNTIASSFSTSNNCWNSPFVCTSKVHIRKPNSLPYVKCPNSIVKEIPEQSHVV